MYRMASVLLLTGMLAALFAQTNIGGNLGGMTLDSTGNPYVVDRDIIIPKGKYLVIKAGCNLMFNPFTGITVHGNLKVDGTQEHPVLFTSINDSTLNPHATQSPDAFDWNGILVAKESGDVEVRFANLRYSVYGIKCQNPDILIMQSVFRQNGQFHFTINDKIQNVPENEPFSYNINKARNKTVSEGDGAQPSGVTRSTEPSRPKLLLRYSALGVGVAGLLCGTVFAFIAKDYYDKANNYLTDAPGHTQEGHKALVDKYWTNATISGISFGLGGVGLVGFGLTFVF